MLSGLLHRLGLIHWRTHVDCEILSRYRYLTLSSKPLVLKLRTENTPDGNVSVLKKLPYIARKSFCAHMRCYFGRFEEGAFPYSQQWKHFFSCIYRSVGTGSPGQKEFLLQDSSNVEQVILKFWICTFSTKPQTIH